MQSRNPESNHEFPAQHHRRLRKSNSCPWKDCSIVAGASRLSRINKWTLWNKTCYRVRIANRKRDVNLKTLIKSLRNAALNAEYEYQKPTAIPRKFWEQKRIRIEDLEFIVGSYREQRLWELEFIKWYSYRKISWF